MLFSKGPQRDSNWKCCIYVACAVTIQLPECSNITFLNAFINKIVQLLLITLLLLKSYPIALLFLRCYLQLWDRQYFTANVTAILCT